MPLWDFDMSFPQEMLSHWTMSQQITDQASGAGEGPKKELRSQLAAASELVGLMTWGHLDQMSEKPCTWQDAEVSVCRRGTPEETGAGWGGQNESLSASAALGCHNPNEES